MDEDFDLMGHQDSRSDETLSSSSGVAEDDLPLENHDEVGDLRATPSNPAATSGRSEFSAVKIATVTCLHAYAIERMKGGEDMSLPWPPLLLVVLKHLNGRYARRELVTERNIAMLELLLRVPIQLRLVHSSGTIDLNEDASLDFRGMAFVEALEVLRDLLKSGVVKRLQVREAVVPLC